MLRRTYHFLLAALLTCIIGTLRAQPLDSLLVAADTANLELKALYNEYLAALERGPQVRQLPDPEVGLGVFVLPVETRLGPQWVRVSATQMFPWFGTLDAREDYAMAMARSQYERISALRLQLHFQVKQAYYQLFELQEKQEIQKSRIEIYKSLEQIATSRMETGRGSLAEVLRIQIRIRDLEEDLRILENRKTAPRVAVNRLLNREDTAQVVIMHEYADLTSNIIVDRAGLLAKIREQHPMLRMISLQQEVSESAIRLNQLEGKPSIAVGLDYINVGKRSDMDPAGNGRDILSPRIQLRVPLYRGKYEAKEQEERLRIDALRLRREDQYLQFRNALDVAISGMENQLIKYNLYSELNETTQSTLDLLITAYSTEGKGFSDLLIVEDELVQYDLRRIEAYVGMQLAQAEIEQYIP